MSAEMRSPSLSLAGLCLQRRLGFCESWPGAHYPPVRDGAVSFRLTLARHFGGDIWRKSVQATWTRFGHEWRELSRSPVRPGIATRWRSGMGLFTGARLRWFAVLTARTWRMR